MIDIKWRMCSAGKAFPSDAIVIPVGNPKDKDPRLVRTAIWDSKYILVSDLLKLRTEKRRKVTDIKWDTDGECVAGLPGEACVPDDIDENEVADYLSDKYGFCVESFSFSEQ